MANEKVSFKLGDYINLPESPNIELGALYLAKTTNNSGHLYYGLSRDKLLPVVSMNPQFTNGLKIATGIKQDLYVPEGTTGALGAVKQHKAENCTTYTSDDGATTPAAIKKLFNSFYAVCSTEEAITEKIVSCQPFSLVTGARIIIKFTYTNTAINPTLNVNNTGAKSIYYKGTPIGNRALKANSTYEFVYNGSRYELIGDLDTNTIYSLPVASDSVLGGIKTGDDIEVNTDGEVIVKYAEALKVSGAGTASHPVYFNADGRPDFCQNLFLVANNFNYGTSDPSTLQPDLLQGSFQEGQLYFQIID